MVYLVGLADFIGGFVIGQLLLSFLLRDYSNEEILELMKDPIAKTRYGMINWLTAFVSALICVWAYNNYF